MRCVGSSWSNTWRFLIVLLLTTSGLLGTGALPASAEGPWSNSGEMNTARYKHAAATLEDGRILISGGFGPSELYGALPEPPLDTHASAEIYDPATGEWTETGSMLFPRRGHTLTRLKDGRVLAVGGETRLPLPANLGVDQMEIRQSLDVFVPLSIAEVYDPDAGTWSLAGSMSVPRVGHEATLIDGPSCNNMGNNPPAHCGEVFVTGGASGNQVWDSTELYDPMANDWDEGPRMAVPRRDHTATQLEHVDKIVVVGGRDGGTTHLTGEFYSPMAGHFMPAGSMQFGRWNHTATLLKNGDLLVAGALPRDPSDTAELFHEPTTSWTRTGDLTLGRRFGHTATRLDDGRVLAVGAYTFFTPPEERVEEIYDPATGEWTSVAPLIALRDGHTASLLPDGTVLVVGGKLGPTYYASTELFDPSAL